MNDSSYHESRAVYGMAIVSASMEKAEEIGRRIVHENLAACAQCTAPVHSIYWWKGKVEEENERLIFLKTSQGLLPKIGLLLQEIHPYEVPELVFLPFSWASEDYLVWLGKSISEHGGEMT